MMMMMMMNKINKERKVYWALEAWLWENLCRIGQNPY
jgi:hypothetical protein